MGQVQYYGTGRRKTSTARVRIVPGTGRIIINDRDSKEYFPYDEQLILINQPLVTTETEGTYDVLVNVNGGGFTGQAGAIRHGISRALIEANPDYRSPLKKEGYLTRDARMAERKKYGRRKARKSGQFSKR